MSTLKVSHSFRPIYNYPVDPERSEHYARAQTKPVTRAELKCDFRTSIFMKHPDSQACWQALLDYKLATVVGSNYWSHWVRTGDGREIHGWRENFKKLADAGIYLGYFGMPALRSQTYHSGGTLEDCLSISQFLKETFGEKYLGAKGDSEMEGNYSAFIKDVLGIEKLLPDRSRQQAHEEYDKILNFMYKRAGNHGMSIVSWGFGSHYAAEHGARMLCHEAGEALPSDTMRWCFVRGAGKQYDLLTWGAIAVLDHWGQKFYTRDGQNYFHNYSSSANISWQSSASNTPNGPDYGHTEGFLKREWYLAYMNGSSIIHIQIGLFYQLMVFGRNSGDYEPFVMLGGANIPTYSILESNLTPLGRIHLEGQEFAINYPFRGVPYMPVALMLDYDHGWRPPYYPYRKEGDCSWVNIPYTAGDYQIDNFFRWVYPDYEKSSCYRDERGFLTNSPFGDMYEVILTNASPQALEKYRVIILLGDLEVERREGLSRKLMDFVQDGGIVVTGVDQWQTISQEIKGIQVTGEHEEYSGDIESIDGKRFSEAPFTLAKMEVTRGEVLLKTTKNDPLVARVNLGKGSIYVIAVPGWGQKEKRHEILSGIKNVLGSLFYELNLIEVEGRDIYYMVNVTDNPAEILVSLLNNSPNLPWEGRIRIKGRKIKDFEAWLGYAEACLKDGVLECGVPPADVRIFKLRAEHDFLPLLFSKIDWRSLGVGIPEVDLWNCPARRPSRRQQVRNDGQH